MEVIDLPGFRLSKQTIRDFLSIHLRQIVQQKDIEEVPNFLPERMCITTRSMLSN
jgi:hypothetical protein